MPVTMIINNKPVAEQETSLYKGLLVTEIQEIKDSVLHFKGKPMPFYVWAAACSFLDWTYREFKGEAQVRLMYRESDGRWTVVVAPQYISSSMHTDEIKDHADKDKAYACLAQGFSQVGTIHHHCSCSAFQSGTDYQDEINQNGIHFTVGHLGQDKWDIHYRATLRGAQYKIDLKEWLGFEEARLSKRPPKDMFPAEWKTRMVKKPEPVWSHNRNRFGVHGYYDQYGYHSYYGGNEYSGFGFGDYDNDNFWRPGGSSAPAKIVLPESVSNAIVPATKVSTTEVKVTATPTANAGIVVTEEHKDRCLNMFISEVVNSLYDTDMKADDMYDFMLMVARAMRLLRSVALEFQLEDAEMVEWIEMFMDCGMEPDYLICTSKALINAIKDEIAVVMQEHIAEEEEEEKEKSKTTEPDPHAGKDETVEPDPHKDGD